MKKVTWLMSFVTCSGDGRRLFKPITD